MKKTIALLIAVALIFTVLPLASASAVKAEIWDGSKANGFAGGNGSAANPYLIQNGAQLYYLVTSCGSKGKGLYYKIVNDIYLNDITDYSTWGIANPPQNQWLVDEAMFYGTLDGDNHVIHGLYITDAAGDDVGLFARIYGATLKNIGLSEIYINASEKYVGGLFGYTFSGGTVINCHSNGYIKSSGISTKQQQPEIPTV